MYIFNRDEIKPFDIILFRFPGDKTSDFIRRFCKSEYSHAVIYIGDDSFAEGVEPVVTLFSTYRYFFKDFDNLKVLRLKKNYAGNFDPAKAEKMIRSLVYCNYSNSLLSSMRKKDLTPEHINRFKDEMDWTGGVVCSTMVSLPYYAGGIDISKNNEPYYVDFGQIEGSEYFEDVTTTAVKQTDKEPHNKMFDYFKLAPTGTLLEKQAAIVAQLNNFVEELFKELIAEKNKYPELNIKEGGLLFSNWEDIYPHLMQWFPTAKGKEIDDRLYKEIVSSGYTTLWFEEVHSKTELYFPFYPILTHATNPDFYIESIRHYQITGESFQHSMERMSEAEDSMFHNFSQCPGKSFHLLLDMYRSWSDQLRSTIDQYKGITKEYNKLKAEVGA